MGKNTRISWTETTHGDGTVTPGHTWNPWMGCHKISDGCKSCYMFREMGRYGRDPNAVQRSKAVFNAPMKWKEPAKVFTCSWSDFFIEEADNWRAEAWDIIKNTPHLTYQILTKRPENIKDRLPLDWGIGYPNVWLGVTAENQGMADRRIPLLLNKPAIVHFVSCEPLLEKVDIACYLDGAYSNDDAFPNPRVSVVDWVIVGGESGPNFRQMDLDWARSIRDQCQEAGVAFFLKQLGGLRPGGEAVLDGRIWHEFPKVTSSPSPNRPL